MRSLSARGLGAFLSGRGRWGAQPDLLRLTWWYRLGDMGLRYRTSVRVGVRSVGLAETFECALLKRLRKCRRLDGHIPGQRGLTRR